MKTAIAFRKYEEQKRELWLESHRKAIKTIVKYTVLSVCGIILFHAGSVFAYAERGYKDIGGEMFCYFFHSSTIWFLVHTGK